jgi:hypothetical protein
VIDTLARIEPPKAMTRRPVARGNGRDLRLPDASPEYHELVKLWASSPAAVMQGLSVSEILERAEWGIPPVGGGAVGTSQVTLQNVPVAPYTIDPGSFFAATEPNFLQAAAAPAFSAGAGFGPIQLPAVGIYESIEISFNGTVAQTTAVGTTTAAWPYDMLPLIQFVANGQDNLYSCSGMMLKDLEAVRYPYLISGSATPTLPQSGSNVAQGDVTGFGIGGGLNVPVAATPISLTWEIPFAIDQSSLVGGVFAQARSLNLLLQGNQASIAHLITNSTGTTVISGTFSIGLKTYSVPVAGNGQNAQLLIPDLRFLHGFNQVPTPFSNVGDVRTIMNRVDGSLMRIFHHAYQLGTDPLVFYVPYGAASATLGSYSKYTLQFGGNKNPWNYNPASFLVDRNVFDYGAPLPYHAVCLDLARYNAVRDAINLAGVTELYWIATIAGGATAPGASASSIIVQETLFQ